MYTNRVEPATSIVGGMDLKEAVDALEVRTLLSGEYDSREALITIRSGAGGGPAPASHTT